MQDRGKAGWQSVLADVARAGTPRGRVGVGCVVIEGTRIHERALRAGVVVARAVIAASLAATPPRRVQQLLEGLHAAGCHLVEAPDEAVRRAMGGRGTGAIVGLARMGPLQPLPEPYPPERSDLLVAVEIEDPGNVGALVRTALASGAAGFVAVGISDPFHPKAVRTSMGSVFRLPVYRYESISELMPAMERAGVETWAAVSSGGEALPAARRSGRPVAVMVGSEAFGLVDTAISRADRRITVPMTTDVDSYSVNAAAAIVLYELALSRGPIRR